MEENPFNLIVDVQTQAANTAEDHFLTTSIARGNDVLDTNDGGPTPINHVTTDGGYDSRDNRQIMTQADAPHWNMGQHKGYKLRYQISKDDQGNLTVYCKKTQSICPVNFSDKAHKYVIQHPDGTKRYMEVHHVKDYFILQQQLDAQREEDRKIRANVEATIHQVFHLSLIHI